MIITKEYFLPRCIQSKTVGNRSPRICVKMRNNDGHKRLFDALSGALSIVTDSLNNTRLDMKRYVLWLSKSGKMLQKVAQVVLNFTKGSPQLHPDITSTQNEIFTNFSGSGLGVGQFVDKNWADQAAKVLEDNGKLCDELTSSFKDLLQNLSSLYESLSSQELKKPTEQSSTEIALNAGFEHYRCYLRYVRDLNTIEENLNGKLDEAVTVLNAMMSCTDESAQEINKLYVENFGLVAGGEVKSKPSGDYVKVVDGARQVAETTFAAFRQPCSVQSQLYTFAEESSIKMSLREKYDSLEAEDVVDVVNANGMDYWVVRKAGGSDVSVPALLLKPWNPKT